LDNYTKLANDNLRRLYESMPSDLKDRLPGDQDGERYAFTAFGKPCSISPGDILLDHADPPGVIAILLSLYALHASREEMVLEPFHAFKEFPDSAPYVGAFTSHTERLLVPEVQRIKERMDRVVERLSGEGAPPSVSGDFAFVVRPLPKISLCYIFYEADEDFPASVTCLFSNNANRFMPMDGLADVGEYTSKRILEIVRSS
jgi:hypothetical protein